jgi:hypothetical protein
VAVKSNRFSGGVRLFGWARSDQPTPLADQLNLLWNNRVIYCAAFGWEAPGGTESCFLLNVSHYAITRAEDNPISFDFWMNLMIVARMTPVRVWYVARSNGNSAAWIGSKWTASPDLLLHDEEPTKPEK